MVKLELSNNLAAAEALRAILKHEKIGYLVAFGPQGTHVFEIETTPECLSQLLEEWQNAVTILRLARVS